MVQLGRLLVVLLILGQASLGCMTALPRDRVSGPSTYKGSVDILLNGFRRTYLVHVPAGYRPEKALPLVVVIHGAFDTAQGMERVSGFSRLADRENFVVLYPNGMGILGFFQHWNAGHCCGIAMHKGVDDVAFVSRAIEQVRSRLRVDAARIYMVGYSNGGMLAYLFAAEKPETLAAFSVIAASIGSRPSPSAPETRIPAPPAPVPLVAFHGLEDDLVPYEGGSRTKRGPFYVSVDESAAFWVKANHGPPAPVRERSREGKVVKNTWSTGEPDKEVVLYTLEGWNHSMPTTRHTHALPETDPLRDFDATEIMWAFFRPRHG